MNRGTLLTIAVLYSSVEQQTALDSLQDRVAVVTGASSGIGKAIAIQLVKEGMHVVGIARRLEVMQNLSASLEDQPGKFHPRKCDVRIEENVVSTFEWINETLGAIAVLVNSAGIAIQGDLVNGNTSYWRDILETDVLGLSTCTREAVHNMMANGISDGQIIHIGSTLGHYYTRQPGSEMYSAAKTAVSSLTESLKRELTRINSTIRVTCIYPGTTNTPLLTNPDFYTSPEDVRALPKLDPIDVADAVLYVLSTRSNTQVVNLIIEPVGAND